MSKAKPIVTVSHSVRGSKAFEKALKEMVKTAAYVGIAKGSERDTRSDNSGIANSDLGFVHEFGSPAAGIPARPFLEPGVESVKEQVKEKMGEAAKAMLNGDKNGFEGTLTRMATDAAEAVREYVKDNQGTFEPLAASTKRARERKIKKVGGSAGDVKILMDTNSLMRAVDGVVVKE